MTIDCELLGGSSRGNCCLLKTPESNILIDARFSGKIIALVLKRRNLTIGDIHAVVITQFQGGIECAYESNDKLMRTRDQKSPEINVNLKPTIIKSIIRQVPYSSFGNDQLFHLTIFPS
jgi:hypothetical protein